MTASQSVPRLFVSYASTDRSRVLAIAVALEEAGTEAWVDVRGIAGGESYGSAIVDAIRDCDAVLLLCSAASLASRNVRQEIALAWRFGRPILPLRLEPVDIPDSLAYWLETAQWIDVLDRPRDAWLPAVLHGLRRARENQVGNPPVAMIQGPALQRNDLPDIPTPLLGREHEVAEISSRLRAGARLLTLTGPGGVGKTRLALGVAQSVADVFPDGVVFVDLAPVTDAALVLAAIAETLGVRDSADRSLTEEVGAFLRARRVLLVLDNVEQVVDAAAEIAAVVATTLGVAVIATSRVPLAVRAEQEVPVGTLPLPAAGAPLEVVNASAAVALFLERARATGVDLAVTERNAATLAGIVRRLDGLPLAIELAAARVRLFPPDALLARLEYRLPLLTGGARDLPERQQTLTRTIEWSYILLDPPEQVLFRRLAVFAGGCTFAAVEAVAVVDGDVDPYGGLAEVLRHNLLRQERTEGEPRFAMLETIREYAADQLAASGEAEHMRQRHARYFLQRSGGEEPPRPTGDALVAWLDDLDTDHDNFRTALAWAIDQPGDETAVRLAANLGLFWYFRGHFSEGRRWLAQVLAADVPGPPELASRAWYSAATLAKAHGDPRAAAANAQAAVSSARLSGGGGVIARALYALGAALQTLGDANGAAAALDEALELARGVAGLEALVGSILNVLGDVAYTRGDRIRAVQLVEEGLALKRSTGDDIGAGTCLNMLGYMAFDQQNLERANACFEEALSLFRQVGSRAEVATALLNLGCVAIDRQADRRAAALTCEALTTFRKLGDRSGVAQCLWHVAQLAERHTRSDLAAEWLGAADAILTAIGEPIAVELREEHAARLKRVRDGLGNDTFTELWNLGQARAEEEIAAEALAWGKGLETAL